MFCVVTYVFTLSISTTSKARLNFNGFDIDIKIETVRNITISFKVKVIHFFIYHQNIKKIGAEDRK